MSTECQRRSWVLFELVLPHQLNALKTHLLHKYRKLEYGVAPPDEWDRAMAAHGREYGDALREQGDVDETNVVVRSGSGRRGRRR